MPNKQKPRGRPFQKGHPYRFKPGQSGNPAGRQAMWISEQVNMVLKWPVPAEPRQAWADLVDSGAPIGVMIAYRLCWMAIAGDWSAVMLVYELAQGAPTRRVRRVWHELAAQVASGTAPRVEAEPRSRWQHDKMLRICPWL